MGGRWSTSIVSTATDDVAQSATLSTAAAAKHGGYETTSAAIPRESATDAVESHAIYAYASTSRAR